MTFLKQMIPFIHSLISLFFVAILRYDSPLPTLPPGLPASSDDEIPTEPLPQTPPPFENDVMDERRFLERENSAGWESGIDMDPTDDGYVDDVQVATPFLPRTGYTLVGIDKENVSEPNVFSKGNRKKTETSVGVLEVR